MRVVNTMLGRGLGGIEQALLDYGDALAFKGHEVFFVIHPDAAVRPLLEARGAQFFTLSNFGAWDVFAAARLRRWLAKIAPDAAIAHGNRALSLLRRASAHPLLAPMHNYSIHCKHADVVLYPTQDLLRHAQAQCGSRQRYASVPNLVRVPAFKTRARHIPPVIGSMGRFVAKKGFDVFIEALTLLKARGLPFRACLGGDGDEASTLKALAAERHLGNALTFTGWVNDKQAFFDSIDIFCLPSLEEPFGIVLLEAMAESLPVVATNCAGPAEILHGGENGLLAPTNNPEALADALAELLTDDAYAQRLSAAAHATVKARYDLPVVAEALEKALRQGA